MSITHTLCAKYPRAATWLQRATNGHVPPVNGWKYERTMLPKRIACLLTGHQHKPVNGNPYRCCTRCFNWKP